MRRATENIVAGVVGKKCAASLQKFQFRFTHRNRKQCMPCIYSIFFTCNAGLNKFYKYLGVFSKWVI